MLTDCRPIRLKYSLRIPNVGERINPALVATISGLPTAYYPFAAKTHLLVAGSTLASAAPLSHIWGAGLRRPDAGVGAAAADAIYAVRGKLTYSALRKAGISLGDIPLGDPGFIAPKLLGIKRSAVPRFAVGIVPHCADRADPRFRRLLSDPIVKDLNVHLDPEQFLNDMADCQVVVSSSLYGLIFAEALEIPNLWVTVREDIGSRFKFDDWFSTTVNPQRAPLVLSGADTAAELATHASLHTTTIDPSALLGAFPLNLLEELRETEGRRLIPTRQCRSRPTPVFLISFNRGTMLRQSVEALRGLRRPPEIVVQDNGSSELLTLQVLADLEQEGVRIFRRSTISDPDELNKVQDTVGEFFADWAEPTRYVVSDCDIDVSIARPEILEVYDELLNVLGHIDCVAPMLRMHDIPRAYPLYNWVHNRYIPVHWLEKPRLLQGSFGQVAYRELGIDTIFGLHRAGEPFRRHKKAARVYEPYAARHLDWYLESIGNDVYGSTSSKALTHWNNSEEYELHRHDKLQYPRYFDVRVTASGHLEIIERTVSADGADEPAQQIPAPVVPPAPGSPEERAARLQVVGFLMHARGTDILRWRDPAQHDERWAERGGRLARLVRPGERVFEFGAGRFPVVGSLPAGCTYTGSDVIPFGEGMVVFDLNSSRLPDVANHDVAMLSGVIEYIHDLPRLLKFLAANFRSVVCSYPAATSGESVDTERRRYQGWYNDLTVDQLVDLFHRVELQVTVQGAWEEEILLRFDKAERLEGAPDN